MKICLTWPIYQILSNLADHSIFFLRIISKHEVILRKSNNEHSKKQQVIVTYATEIQQMNSLYLGQLAHIATAWVSLICTAQSN